MAQVFSSRSTSSRAASHWRVSSLPCLAATAAVRLSKTGRSSLLPRVRLLQNLRTPRCPRDAARLTTADLALRSRDRIVEDHHSTHPSVASLDSPGRPMRVTSLLPDSRCTRLSWVHALAKAKTLSSGTLSRTFAQSSSGSAVAAP